MRRFLTLAGCFLLSAGIVVLPLLLSGGRAKTGGWKEGMFSQTVESVTSSPRTVCRVYAKGELVGILSAREKLDRFLDTVYEERYAQEYPGSEAALGEDVYVTGEQSYFTYSDADDEILGYLADNDLFSLKATVVSFADDQDVFARIYVSDQSLYEQAMEEFLGIFISPESRALLTSGRRTPELTDYGSREVGISISETITTGTAFAPVGEIMMTKEEVLEYLEYGDSTEKEYYTVQENDTVAGVGARNNGLSAVQVMNINRDRIRSTDQVLTAGEQLCVTYFNSPLTVTVTRESLKEEEISPGTQYVQDESLQAGTQKTVQEGIPGRRNALYQETWINGVLVKGTLLSSVDVQQPADEIVSVGDGVPSGAGTGSFQWPTENAAVSCGWECYENHHEIDIINLYDRYGDVLAADSGVITESGWDADSGNYVVIDHQNGFYTYYAHMNNPSPLPAGTVVEKGEVIGQIGMTGQATGPQVSFYIGVGDPYSSTDPCGGYLSCQGYTQ